MDAEPTDDLPLIRCAVYTRQSVVRAGDDPALASCAVQRTLCTEFIRSMAWRGWYPIGGAIDAEAGSLARLQGARQAGARSIACRSLPGSWMRRHSVGH